MPEGDHTVPLGVAEVKRSGSDVNAIGPGAIDTPMPQSGRTRVGFEEVRWIFEKPNMRWKVICATN